MTTTPEAMAVMLGLPPLPGPVPGKPDLPRESLARLAAAHDAEIAARTEPRDRRYIASVYLKSPYGPDPRVFGPLDGPRQEPSWHYCGPLVTCPRCRVSWHGTGAETCWGCKRNPAEALAGTA